ncbi:MAG: restriction endonuclease subunit S [Reichenbachiella sp.]|uniref:restriction endonuclease subunit S n=1 Tax=Reichenbachiella sp. TaxID=2184521 RepID=UPI0032636948
MKNPKASYLNSFRYSLLTNWSVRYLLETSFGFNDKYELAPIGKFLIRNKELVEIEDDKEYKRVTIKINNNGVVQRDIEKGENIGTKRQYIVRPGQFIMSKIDARNGAFGLVPPELDGAIVTNDFPSFNVDNKRINTQFLVLITTTKAFVSFAQSCSSGTTNRQRIDIDLFLQQKIPLPSLKEQERIVGEYNKKIRLSEGQAEKAINQLSSIKTYIERELEISSGDSFEKNTLLRFVRSRNTKRWDVLHLLGGDFQVNSAFPVITIRDVIKFFNKKDNKESLRFESYKYPNETFHYIGMENVEKDLGQIKELPLINGKAVKSQTLKVPQGFFIYGKLRPYLNKYWINNTEFDDIICSSEFFVFSINETVDKDYFKGILSSFIIQEQIADKTSGARMPRINEGIFMNLKFPLPPLKNQKSIARHLNQVNDEILNLNYKSEQERVEALSNFEKEIFNYEVD